MILSDDTGRVVYLNPAAQRLLGWTPAEMVGQPLTMLMPARLREAHASGFARYLRTGHSQIIGKSIRVPALCSDGREIDVALKLSDKIDPRTGEHLILAVLRDLGDLIELERRLVVQRRILAQYSATGVLAEAASVGDALPRLLQATTEALGWKVGIFWATDAGSGRLHMSEGWGSLSNGQRFVEGSRAYTFGRGDGVPGIVLEKGEPVWSKDVTNDSRYLRRGLAVEHELKAALLFPVTCGKKTLGVLEFLTSSAEEPDVELLQTMATLGFQLGQFLDRCDTEEQLREIAQREVLARGFAETERRQVEEFLSVASHELRTPLSTLMLQTHGFLREVERTEGPTIDREQVRARLQRNVKQIQRLTTLVEDLLDVTSASAGRLKLSKARTDLADVAREVVVRFSEAASQVGSTLEVRTAGGSVGEWDADRLDQVITNLVSNALKFAPGRPIEILIDNCGNRVRVGVRDQGPGISVADSERIFQRFERAKEAENIGGLGLGLWITREIVKAHGGQITVDSSPGKGAAFWVELPV